MVKRLNTETVHALKQPALHDRLVQNGAVPVGNTPDEFWTYVKGQIAKWGKVIKAARITAN